MIFYPRSRRRPAHLGSFPLETLPREPSIAATETGRRDAEARPRGDSAGELSRIAREYADIFRAFATGPSAAARAPVPDQLERRTVDIKGLAYFLDAALVGICKIPATAWRTRTRADLDTGIVLVIEHGRLPEPDNLAHGWVAPAIAALGEMRAAEIAAVVAGHIRHMGFSACCHDSSVSDLDLDSLAVLAGVAVRDANRIVCPYVGMARSIALVATDYALAADLPLAMHALREARGWRYWVGRNGAQSGRERNRRARRRSDVSRFPMEQVTRVDRPTTLIVDDEVPRVPKRAAFFERALRGDLGAKAQRERSNFSFKHPTSRSLLELIRALVPHQDGAVAPGSGSHSTDAAANARAVKALAYCLGADLAGICEIPRYAWFSHREDGRPIEPYHRYAVAMLIDQGFETMEGASGDDWISGTQSMRGYLRGAEIAGVMGALLRSLGFPARSQTNADSDVLHIPLILWAGLGELSRIGELVLNPFVGPRFKSVVLTTDLPLEADRPIDFGLRSFCDRCRKCARECPCDAISWGDSVMFNGYEMWKPDVERCTRYRLTNARGAACGRCMKTCPLNKVVDADGALATRAASWLGIHARRLKPLLVPIATWLDDKLGHGRRNAVKKWWLDHEIVDGIAVQPKATNERDLDPLRRIDPRRQPIAYYPADMMPAPDAKAPAPLDRKRALAAATLLETPSEALARVVANGPKPAHYEPTPPVGSAAEAASRPPANPYRR